MAICTVSEFRPGYKRPNPTSLDKVGRWFWRLVIPVCLLFWAAVAYGIHSLV